MQPEVKPTPQSPLHIVMIGRSFWDKSRGHTYRSVEIVVNGELVHKIMDTGGYGDQFAKAGMKWLHDNGHLTLKDQHEAPWLWAERTGGRVYHTVTEVTRRKDL